MYLEGIGGNTVKQEAGAATTGNMPYFVVMLRVMDILCKLGLALSGVAQKFLAEPEGSGRL